MGDLTGKRSKRKQTAAMNQMNQMVNDQLGTLQQQQAAAQATADASRDAYSNMEFTNPFADATNPYANTQTNFDNIYAGAQNVYADAQNTFAGARNTFAGARNTFAGMENAYAGLQNQYEGMENRFEDMTVDMRAADFQAQQGQQQRANIMQGLRGAAGGSGIAGLAQALANQGQLQTQQIAAGIGQQERQNQMLAAQEGSRIDQLQRGAGMELQQLQASGAMAVQQAERAGAAQQQQMQMSGAMQQQQMQMQGAAQQQEMQLQGAAQQQAMILAGEADAQALGVQQQNLQAQGEWMANMAQMEGAAAVQAAEAQQQATLLGMDYGALAGANAAVQQGMANQMSAMGMQVDMYGSQSQNNFFSQATDAVVSYKSVTVCVPKGINIDTVNGSMAIENVKPGDIVIGYNGEPTKVLQKHEYLEDPARERFYKVEFDDGAIVDVCDMHRIKGERAMDITEGVKSKEAYSGVEFSYDLLTEDSGYRIDGVPVNSMIPEMAIGIAEIIKNK
tara:strand:- start:10290 stop:11807 length:1518 start_codon:yes stop_codon:yes gene_type:complete